MGGDMVPIPIEIMPRHVHLSEKHWKKLFGSQAPTVLLPLSQRGQVVLNETVTIISKSRRKLAGVRVLGGFRRETQVELSEEEAAALALRPPLRLSGSLNRSAGCLLVGPAGQVELRRGVIVPMPHLHLNLKEAKKLGWKHGQMVELRFLENKKANIKAVVRIHPSFRLSLHLTSDLAASLWLSATEKALWEKR